MARNFSPASTTWVDVNAGQLNSPAIFTFGTIAHIFRQSSTGAWRCLSNINNSGSGVSIDIEINPSNALYISYDGTTTSVTYGNFTSTSAWNFLAITKATGTATPRVHLFDYSTLTWTHADMSGTQPDGSTARNVVRIGAYPGPVEHWAGDIEAVGYFRSWVPTDLEVEQAGLHLHRMAWMEATSRTDAAFVTFLDQGNTADLLVDLVAGGTQAAISATAPTVSAAGVPLLAWSGGSGPQVGFSASAIVNDSVTAATGATASASATKAASGAARGAVGATARASATKAASGAARGAVGAGARVTGTKIGGGAAQAATAVTATAQPTILTSSRAAVGATGRAIGTKIGVAAARSSSAGTARAAAAKIALGGAAGASAATGTAIPSILAGAGGYVGATARASGTKTATGSATCPASTCGRAAAAKTATGAGRCHIGATGRMAGTPGTATVLRLRRGPGPLTSYRRPPAVLSSYRAAPPIA